MERKREVSLYSSRIRETPNPVPEANSYHENQLEKEEKSDTNSRCKQKKVFKL